MENFRFPLFFDLRGRKAVVVGAGKIGLRRAGVLRRFGAEVTLIDPKAEPCEGFALLSRPYERGDLQGAFLCTAATDSRETNHRVFLDARAAGVFISTADNPEECDFFFPAVCEGSGLVAGVVSDGTDHRKTARAAKELRRVLEEIE